MNPLRVAAAALVLVSVSEAAASELIAEKIDRIAALVATGEVQQLGGPEAASEIVASCQEIWPGADVMFIKPAAEVEVWGRCPE